MKTIKYIKNILSSPQFLLAVVVLGFMSCEKDEVVAYKESRLFRPVLSADLYAEGNTIIAEMGNFKDATGYMVEVSRDSFATVEYEVQVDTSVVRINEDLIRE